MSRAPCRPGTTAVKLASDLEMGSVSSISCVTISCFTTLTTSTTGLAPGDGDGFLDRTHLQVDVDGGREVRAQLDAFTADHREPGQREGHGVRAWPQVDDPVDACTVCDGGA